MNLTYPRIGANNRTTHQRLFYVRGALLFVDGLFIVGYLLYAFLNDTAYTGFLIDRHWSLSYDGGYAELYGYVKAAGAAVLLLFLYVRQRRLTSLGWGLALLFMALDDAFSLHERTGDWFVAHGALPTIFGLDGHVYAEMLLWGIIGLGLLGMIALGYLRESETRAFSRRLAYCLAALFFFAGIVDALHLLAAEGEWSRLVVFTASLVEDGGELVVLSFFAAVTVAHASAQLRTKPAPAPSR